jgi:hypothetical protein
MAVFSVGACGYMWDDKATRVAGYVHADTESSPCGCGYPYRFTDAVNNNNMIGGLEMTDMTTFGDHYLSRMTQ